MSWADAAIAALSRGETTAVRPRGSSMEPRVHDGQVVTLRPLQEGEPRRRDVVLVRVRGTVYLHLVTGEAGTRFQIGNNRGHINGWVDRSAIYGKALL